MNSEGIVGVSTKTDYIPTENKEEFLKKFGDGTLYYEDEDNELVQYIKQVRKNKMMTK